MREQIKRRLPDYHGHYPWWAWYKKPRAKPAHPINLEGDHIRIELSIPSSKVLLSDHSAWVNILNCFYLALSSEEFEQWSAKMAIAGFEPAEWPLPEPWRSEVLMSWERIFDLPFLRSEGWKTTYIQATFEGLELSEVTRIDMLEPGFHRL